MFFQIQHTLDSVLYSGPDLAWVWGICGTKNRHGDVRGANKSSKECFESCVIIRDAPQSLGGIFGGVSKMELLTLFEGLQYFQQPPLHIFVANARYTDIRHCVHNGSKNARELILDLEIPLLFRLVQPIHQALK